MFPSPGAVAASIRSNISLQQNERSVPAPRDCGTLLPYGDRKDHHGLPFEALRFFRAQRLESLRTTFAMAALRRAIRMSRRQYATAVVKESKKAHTVVRGGSRSRAILRRLLEEDYEEKHRTPRTTTPSQQLRISVLHASCAHQMALLFLRTLRVMSRLRRDIENRVDAGVPQVVTRQYWWRWKNFVHAVGLERSNLILHTQSRMASQQRRAFLKWSVLWRFKSVERRRTNQVLRGAFQKWRHQYKPLAVYFLASTIRSRILRKVFDRWLSRTAMTIAQQRRRPKRPLMTVAAPDIINSSGLIPAVPQGDISVSTLSMRIQDMSDSVAKLALTHGVAFGWQREISRKKCYTPSNSFVPLKVVAQRFNDLSLQRKSIHRKRRTRRTQIIFARWRSRYVVRLMLRCADCWRASVLLLRWLRKGNQEIRQLDVSSSWCMSSDEGTRDVVMQWDRRHAERMREAKRQATHKALARLAEKK